MSNATAFVHPRSAWVSHAVAGSSRSGVAVDRITTSTSPGSTPARSIAMREASAPMWAAQTWSGAMRRSRIPVRVRIHSSEVSSRPARSSFVTTWSGRNRPVATTSTCGWGVLMRSPPTGRRLRRCA